MQLWPCAFGSLMLVLSRRSRVPGHRRRIMSLAAGCVAVSAFGYVFAALIADRPVPLVYPPMPAAIAVSGCSAGRCSCGSTGHG